MAAGAYSWVSSGCRAGLSASAHTTSDLYPDHSAACPSSTMLQVTFSTWHRPRLLVQTYRGKSQAIQDKVAVILSFYLRRIPPQNTGSRTQLRRSEFPYTSRKQDFSIPGVTKPRCISPREMDFISAPGKIQFKNLTACSVLCFSLPSRETTSRNLLKHCIKSVVFNQHINRLQGTHKRSKKAYLESADTKLCSSRGRFRNLRFRRGCRMLSWSTAG